uniref:hypothetical protein n=1 Tax=Prevotella sp. TaxID=59823 RepID=UPI0040283F91
MLPLLVSTTRSSTPTTSATILTISARLEMTFTRLEMTFTRLEMTFTKLEMTFGTKKNIRNAGQSALRIRVNTMMMITVCCGRPQLGSL